MTASSVVIRRFNLEDVEQVSHIESRAFADQGQYPGFLFAQFSEIAPHGFFVGVDPSDSKVVGYVIAVISEVDRRTGWILSLAVLPEKQHSGIGNRLMAVAESYLEQHDCATIKLTVGEQNTSARRLYEMRGYSLKARRQDYMGPGIDRLVLQRQVDQLQADTPTVGETRDLLVDEATASVDFVNILFGVSLSVLAFLGGKLATEPVLAIILFLIVISSFYSTLFYAATVGNVARLRRNAQVAKSIEYGNALSEYFGVYGVVAAFPMVVQVATGSNILALAALFIDIIGFGFYSLSGSDMLARPIQVRGWRVGFPVSYVALVSLIVISQMLDEGLLQILAAVLMVCMMGIVTVVHLRRGEALQASGS